MAPSPKVATYDLQPEMSAAEVTQAFVGAIKDGYDLIVCNYANPDMVGHTGDIGAAVKACEAVDAGLGAVLDALETAGGTMIVTADHGNCETMIDPESGGPHTAHTTNPVPVALVGGPVGATLHNGRLGDLAPWPSYAHCLHRPFGRKRLRMRHKRRWYHCKTPAGLWMRPTPAVTAWRP